MFLRVGVTKSCKLQYKTTRGRRDRIHRGIIAPFFSNTVRTPHRKLCLGNNDMANESANILANDITNEIANETAN